MRVLVPPVHEQRPHLTVRQGLLRRLDPVDGPPRSQAVLHGLRMGPLPRALALLAQCQSSLPHLGGRDGLGIEPHDAEQEVVQVGVQVRHQRGGIHTDPRHNESGQRGLDVDPEDCFGDPRIVAVLFLADAPVVPVLPSRARHGAAHDLPLTVEFLGAGRRGRDP